MNCGPFFLQQIFVNFDPQVLELIQEAKAMIRMGLQVNTICDFNFAAKLLKMGPTFDDTCVSI